MLYVRTTKTASSKIAVQVVKYRERKTVVVKHIGSGKNKKEINQLRLLAEKWIETITRQRRLFKNKGDVDDHKLTPMAKYQYLGTRRFFAYEVINKLFKHVGFVRVDRLLLDLVLIRLLEPASKLKSIILLEKYFSITYSRSSVYRALPAFASLKEKVQQIAIQYAKNKLSFDFSVIFYDVTTLYFETDKSDDLRRCGFSKDHKFNQPQILLGLVINQSGFPLCYEIFEGKKYEGHTMLPVIDILREKHKIKNMTVVADAAMISVDNIVKLLEHKLNYIVGARIAGLSLPTIKKISQELNRKEGSFRLTTKHGILICDFSSIRYRKDKHEMNKQIRKAKAFIQDPDKNKQARKGKFVKTVGKTKYILNKKLIDKTNMILGVKGYYTNLENIDNLEVIKQYHNLWKVEKAFRISKSDLKTRPIFHFKEKTIQSHMLLCFMALCIAKHIEIKTNKSLQTTISRLKEVTDAIMLNTITNKESFIRSPISEELKQLLKALDVSY